MGSGRIRIFDPIFTIPGRFPRFRLAALLLPVLHLAAAYAVRRERRWPAVLLILPFLAVVAWVGWSVLNQ